MHQAISHNGICRRLDCWQVEAYEMNHHHKSLEDFAASKPSFEDLQEMAKHLAWKYIADHR